MEKLQAALDKARRERQGKKTDTLVTPRASMPKKAGGLSKVTDRWAALPVLQVDEASLIRNRVVSYSASHDAMPVDMLRTKVQLFMRKHGWKRVAITSAEKNVGKTTLACNLALSISRQTGTRTVLLDLDMRVPSVAKVLGQKGGNGIEAVLSNRVPVEDHLKCFFGNLAVSMSDERILDPMRYAIGPELETLMNELEQDYEPDLMICDLPPLLAVDETRAILKNMDCAIIVARAEQTSIKNLDQCERVLAEQCNSLGIVINGCRYVEDALLYGDGHY